jgi:hypothetical protein
MSLGHNAQGVQSPAGHYTHYHRTMKLTMIKSMQLVLQSRRLKVNSLMESTYVCTGRQEIECGRANGAYIAMNTIANKLS